jgi:transposase InsO family protein
VAPGNSDLVDTLGVQPPPFLHPSFYLNGHYGSGAGLPSHSCRSSDGVALREAFARDSAPRILLRDRDRIFGSDFTKQVKELGIQEVLGAPRAPQQRAYIERMIGTIRASVWTT